MRKLLFVAIINLILVPAIAFAANTTILGNGNAKITGLDADWTYSTDGGSNMSNGVNLISIQFIPSATSDRMIIRDGGIDGAAVFDSGAVTDTKAVIEYYHGSFAIPVIDISDCTLSTAANAKVIIRYE